MKLYKGSAQLSIADVSGETVMVGKFTFQVVGSVIEGQSPEVMASEVLMKHIRQTGSLAVSEVTEVPAEQSVVSLRPCK